MLIDADVSYVCQQGEVDGVAHVLLVVSHELVDVFVLFAVDVEASIVLPDELYRLAEPVLGEVASYDTQVKFADEAVCDGVSMQDGPSFFHGPFSVGSCSTMPSLMATLFATSVPSCS